MVVFHEMSLVVILPSVSIPAKHVNQVMPEDGDKILSDKGVASSR